MVWYKMLLLNRDNKVFIICTILRGHLDLPSISVILKISEFNNHWDLSFCGSDHLILHLIMYEYWLIHTRPYTWACCNYHIGYQRRDQRLTRTMSWQVSPESAPGLNNREIAPISSPAISTQKSMQPGSPGGFPVWERVGWGNRPVLQMRALDPSGTSRISNGLLHITNATICFFFNIKRNMF